MGKVKLIFNGFILLLIFLGVSFNAFSSSTIIVTNSKSWKPYSYINEYGEPDGIIIDLWKTYAKKNNVKVEFLLLDWEESIFALDSGLADVHGGLEFTDKREKSLIFGEPLMPVDIQLYFRQSSVSSDASSFLLGTSTKPLGIVKASSYELLAERDFPNNEIKSYKNNDEMIKAAFNGEIIAFISDLQVANFYLYSNKTPTRFIPVKSLYSSYLYPAALKKNKTKILSINAGFTQLSDDEKSSIRFQWSHVQTVYPKYLFHVLLSLTVIMSLIYIIVLRVIVKRRTKDLLSANEKLSLLATTDELTGIRNRRYLFEKLEESSSDLKSVAIYVFDIDNFKFVNDTFGHNVGDEVIKRVTQETQAILFENTTFARIGGEEFAIFACDYSYEQAKHLADNICYKINSIKFHDYNSLNVSVSLGCVFYKEIEHTLDLVQADALMYLAKRDGKNKAIFSEYVNDL